MLWMVALYLAYFSWIYWRSELSWLPLVACVAVLAVKRPDWSPCLIAIAVTMTVVAALSWKRREPANSVSSRFFWAPVVLVWALWSLAIWEAHASTRTQRSVVFTPNRSVVCVGDSVTAGISDMAAYPSYLQELLSVPVVNIGRPGISARDMLNHLPAIRDARPQVVVIELGGNDFLRGYTKESTRESLRKLIVACRELDAEVVLVEIPRGFIIDPYSGLERELARNFDLELIPDTAIRMLVLRSPSSPLGSALSQPYLSDDGLHPNAGGARYLAEKVRIVLMQIYGSQIANELGMQ